MVYELFDEESLVDFSEATVTISSFFAEGQTLLPPEGPAAQSVADLMLLNAAELTVTLPPLEDLGWGQRPVRVTESAARAAIVATNSGPFVGHDPRDQPQLWDVTLLGSDASKLSWLAETTSLDGLSGRFLDAVKRLSELYADRHDVTLGYWPKATLPIRASLWRGKIAVLNQEADPRGDILEVWASLGGGEALGRGPLV